MVKNVFPIELINEIRRRAEDRGFENKELILDPFFREIVLHPTILKIAKQILGCTPVYFGDSSCVKSLQPYQGAWHTDNADRLDVNAPDWKGKYDIIRFAIYLQDHRKYSKGLMVKECSHLSPKHANKGRIRYFASQPGDLIVWNMRTVHCGNAGIIKGWENYPIEPSKTKYIPKIFMLSGGPLERIGLFTAFGANGAHLERYLNYLKTRQYMVNRWRAAEFTNNTREAIQTKDVIVREMYKEIQGVSDAGVYEFHHPLSY